MPVFAKNSWEKAFDQCQPARDYAGIYFTRKQVLGRKLSWSAQENLVKAKKLEVTPLFIRTWAHCFSLLEYNTCLDNQAPLTYARAPDTLRCDSRYYRLAVGGFAPLSGVRVHSFYDDVHEHVGVAPGVPAEVRYL